MPGVSALLGAIGVHHLPTSTQFWLKQSHGCSVHSHSDLCARSVMQPAMSARLYPAAGIRKVASVAPPASAAPMLEMCSEICLAALPSFLCSAQPIGRLAATGRSLAADMKDSNGQLRVGAIVTGRLSSAVAGLKHACLEELSVFRLDLSRESKEVLSKVEIEQAVRQLALRLSKASALQVLAIRLPSFDASMERLRLGLTAWEALISCLGELARYGRLHSLELSSITIKNSRATQQCSTSAFNSCEDESVSLLEASPSGSKSPRKLRRAATSPTPGKGADAAAATAKPKLSFLDALAGLSTLEELRLTHNEIFGNTAQLLPPVFQKLASLKRVDLTRNHISKQVMQELRADMPENMELCGDDHQTFYFY